MGGGGVIPIGLKQQLDTLGRNGEYSEGAKITTQPLQHFWDRVVVMGRFKQ